jgi:4-hydroxymandelate synthase
MRSAQADAEAAPRTAPQESIVAALDIEYVELYVTDKQSVADYFVSSMGFTLAAESVDYGGSSALLRQGTVQLVITAGPGAEEFVGAHGDGVADAVLACDDVEQTRDAAVAAGASVTCSAAGFPVVAGFGGIRHTLVDLAGHKELRLPPGRDWQPVPVAPGDPGRRIKALDHVAICCTGGMLARDTEFYSDGLSLARYSGEYIELGDQAMDSIVVRSQSGGITFTLLEPDLTMQPGQLDAFLSRNGGPGVQHLAFAVDDIRRGVSEFRGHGVEFLHTPDSYYDRLAMRLPDIQEEIARLRAANVLVDREEWGYLMQVFTRSPYERNTLFYELIERRGARGFGSANIRALYEAVECDRLGAE